LLISRLNHAFFSAASIPNTSRDGGTGREDGHYSIINNPEKKSGNFICLNMEKMENRFIFYIPASRFNFYES
jgi:hypothetical protein